MNEAELADHMLSTVDWATVAAMRWMNAARR